MERNFDTEKVQMDHYVINKEQEEEVNHPKHYNTNPSGVECVAFQAFKTYVLSDIQGEPNA